MSRPVVALVFGGRSPEHDVSLVSARGIRDRLDHRRWELVLVGVTRDGRPVTGGEELLGGGMDRGEGTPVRWPSWEGDSRLREEETGRPCSPPIDVVFPIIHGAGGEDGSLQGLLQMARLPYVGAGVLGSALAMDKDRARRMIASAGVPVIEDRVFTGPAARDSGAVRSAVEPLGLPLFVKPARAGSSVGISLVEDWTELPRALEAASAVDSKVIVERAVVRAREIEVAVLGGDPPEISVPGEVVPHGAFYDYRAKYEDPESKLLIPAPLEPDLTDRIRDAARRAFTALELDDLARVDFLLSRDGSTLVLNEVNTLPGFTPISMYPKLWEASGIPYGALLDRLIERALARGPR
ncbi:MAG: D-alanine--D-alanine ligase [Acidobacteria bacterium]|nr:MAG: D-alanine--D-alanine ligase [Acidobacteriota bacterium]